MRNFSYYGLLKIAQQASASDAYKQKRIAEMKAKAEAARRYGTTTVTHDGNTTTTTTHAHLYLQPDGSYSDKPAFTFNDDDTVTKNQPQTPAPAPAPAPSAPSPTPATPAPNPAEPAAQQPAAPTPQQPGSQPVSSQPQPPPQQPGQQPAQPQPSYRQQAWNNMDQGQRDAFKNWAKTDGQGGMFGAMFRGADGKVDNAAMDKFMQENPNFLTGTDADRDAIFKKRYGQLTKEQADAFKQSKDYQNYRQVAAARQKAKQQANQSQVDANVSAYEKNKARLQNIYDNPVEATQQMAAKMYRNGVGGNEAAASTVQAWRDARDQLNNDKGFYSAVDRNGNVVASAGGKKESYADYVARTSGAGRYNGQKRTNSYNTGGGIPTAVAGRKVNAPKTGITTVADRGGSPTLYRMQGRTRLYNRG